MSLAITGREPHPAIPLLDPRAEAVMTPEQIDKYYEFRREAMLMERVNPLVHGFTPAVWKLTDETAAQMRAEAPTGVLQQLILGGNRAGKTRYAAKTVMRIMVEKEGARVWCLQSTQAASRADQQSVMFEHIPMEWRPESGKLRQGKDTKINYSRAGGFTEDTFVLPNGSQCWFKFYGANVGSLEGAELDAAWGDELIPPDWIEALRFRLITRDGLLLVTFTPVEGYSSTVKEFLDGAVTTLEVDAELLPKRNALQMITGYEKVPRVQKCAGKTATVVYFHTKDNPYGNYNSMKVELEGSQRERILTRGYGVPTKASMTQFPLFRDGVHIVPMNRWREVELAGGTRYHFVDPCSGRNWFMIWAFIDSLGRKFIYREWPSHGHESAYIPGAGDPGPWTLPGKAADGQRGPGQTELGWGLKRYKEEIERVEASEPIFERWMDARYGNSRTVAAEESTTLIEEMRELKMEFLAAPSEKSILSGRSDGSIRLINDALYYDTSREIGPTNQPHLYVVETCPNTIYALKEWTGQDGQHGACKDPIDDLRMMVLSGVGYTDETMFKPRLPWMAQFSGK